MQKRKNKLHSKTAGIPSGKFVFHNHLRNIILQNILMKNSHNFFSRKKLRSYKKRFAGRTKQLSNPTVLLALGLLFFTVWGIREVHLATRLSFNTAISANELGGNIIHPIKISIPSINTELPVEETLIENGIWQISDKGVSHLATSAYPGNEGNIIFYGHNTNERLGRLPQIEKGDTITVTSKNGRTFEYRVVSTQVVKPTDIDKLTSYSDQTLTIYTCTGFADLKRQLVKAERI